MDEFGYLGVSPLGKLVYKSLSNHIPSVYKGIGNITKIYDEGGNILFVGDNETIIYSRGNYRIINNGGHFCRSFKIGHTVFLNTGSKHFKTIERGRIVQIPWVQKLDASRISAMLPWNGNKILIIHQQKGCFLFDQGKCEPLRTKISNFLIKNKITVSYRLRNGYYTLGSLNNGLLILDPDGKPVQLINKEKGLDNNHIFSFCEDQQGNLWVGHLSGVSCIQISSPITHLDLDGAGGGYAALLQGQSLFLSTSEGVYKINWSDYQNPFSPHLQPVFITRIPEQSWNLTKIDDQFYESSDDGTYLIHNTVSEKIRHSYGGWKFMKLYDHPGYYIQGTYIGFALYQEKHGVLQFLYQIPGFYNPARIFERDSTGTFWVTHGYQGVYRVRLKPSLDSMVRVRFYGKKNGFRSNLGINVYPVGKKMVFTSEYGGIYEYDSRMDSFKLDTEFASYLGLHPKISRLYEDSSGNIWFFELHQTGVLLSQANHQYKMVIKPFVRLTREEIRGFEYINTLDKKNILFGTADGFVDYHPDVHKNYDIPYRALIRQVELIRQKDTVIYWGNKLLCQQQCPVKNFIFPYKNNSLRISFITPFYEGATQLKYSCYLEGFDKGWSGWNSNSTREFTNLHEGVYTFHVKARNIYKGISKESTFSFRVKPPFQRTWLAYLIYIIIISFLVFAIVAIYSRKKISKYRKANLIKEKEIIQLKNRQLHSEIGHKNKELGSLTMHMIKRNEALLHIKDKITENENSTAAVVKNTLSQIVKIIDNDVNSEKEWDCAIRRLPF